MPPAHRPHGRPRGEHPRGSRHRAARPPRQRTAHLPVVEARARPRRRRCGNHDHGGLDGAGRHAGSPGGEHRPAAGARVAERRDPLVRPAVPVHVEAPGPAGARCPGYRWVGGALRRSSGRWVRGRPARRLGVLDVGRGRWPYATRWNWGGGAGRSVEGAVVGIQIGAKWTEGTGFTENGVVVDGRLAKIGAELTWTYDWDQPTRPWRVAHPDGSLDLELHPVFDRHSKVQAGVLATEVHQVFGRWTGHLTTDDGTVHHVEAIQGFAEESRSRW
ncbi:MAG: DUF2804 domain-containing protein [Acidimicrobiales bacterium]